MTAPKRGRGKPPTQGETRTRRITVRMTEGTHSALEARAEAAGKDTAEAAAILLEWALTTNAPSPLGKGLSRIE